MNRTPEPDPQRLIAAHQTAADFYRGQLLHEVPALSYLRSRGIVAATAHAAPWTIGYAPRGWTHLLDHLRQAGYRDAELLAAGLVTTARNGNLIDVFRDRVMFPIRDADGHVVAFTGRDLSGRANTPKYRNTATTTIYRKSHLLYGLAEQLGSDTEPAAVMLVEGPADVVAVARLRRQALGGDGREQPYTAVAPCGTALTRHQVARLAGAVPPGTPLVVAFDPDAAGQAAVDKSYELLRGWAGPVDAIVLPAGVDPAGLVAEDRAGAIEALEHGRRPMVDVLIDQRLTGYRLDEIPGRVSALQAVVPLVLDAAGRDTAHAARLSAHLAARLDLDPLTVFEAIYPPDGHPEVADAPVAEVPPPEAVIRSPPDPRTAIPLGGAGFPDPEVVGHSYARVCPVDSVAATWVEHDAATGGVAWVLAEGVSDSVGDGQAARLAAEVAGRAAVLVGARAAVKVARTAVNVHFAQAGVGRGDAVIAVLASFDGSNPTPGGGRFTVAWAGDVRVYGLTARWSALLTAEHTLWGQAATGGVRVGDGALTSSVRSGAIGVNRIDVPVKQIVMTGRALGRVGPDAVREAVQRRDAASAVVRLTQLGGKGAAALLVRQRRDGGKGRLPVPLLARQDQAQGPVTGAQTIPGVGAQPTHLMTRGTGILVPRRA